MENEIHSCQQRRKPFALYFIVTVCHIILGNNSGKTEQQPHKNRALEASDLMLQYIIILKNDFNAYKN